jgi:two-component system cell cycle sensor histidine kinase PleC
MTTPDHTYTELLSLAVHEFRTPISVVGGYLRMLARDPDPSLNERHRKMIAEAEKSCLRISALIAELSDIGKIDAGILTIARQPVDLFEIVQEVAEVVHEAADRGVSLELRGPIRGAHLMGDAVRLRSAFDAILRAILREIPGPATVAIDRKIRDELGSSSAVVIVAGDADGVQTAYDGEHGTFDEKRGGLGLALPLARRIVEAHGGQLWAPRAAKKSDKSLAATAALISMPLSELNR